MFKAIFILPNLNAGGAEKVFLNIMELLKKDVRVYLIVFNSTGILQKLIPKEVKFINLETKRLRNSLFILPYYIFKIKPNVILSTLLHVNIYLLILNFIFFNRLKIILRETNFHYSNTKQKIIYYFIYKYLYRLSSNIITSSLMMKEDLINNFNIKHKKIFHINNPIIFHNSENDENITTHFKVKTMYYLSIGRLTNQKNFNFLIDTMIQIKNHNFILNIYGEGNDYKKLQKKITSKTLTNKVYIRKNVLNIKKVYENSNVLILTSKWEGMPNVVLEALCCGLIVVCSSTSGAIHELLEDFKNQIFIYNDQEELISILLRFNYSNFKNKKIVNIPENYKNSKIKKQYLELLSKY